MNDKHLFKFLQVKNKHLLNIFFNTQKNNLDYVIKVVITSQLWRMERNLYQSYRL